MVGNWSATMVYEVCSGVYEMPFAVMALSWVSSDRSVMIRIFMRRVEPFSGLIEMVYVESA